MHPAFFVLWRAVSLQASVVLRLVEYGDYEDDRQGNSGSKAIRLPDAVALAF
ncbi:hypothetical protein [Flaviaesturariibacter terrae]